MKRRQTADTITTPPPPPVVVSSLLRRSDNDVHTKEERKRADAVKRGRARVREDRQLAEIESGSSTMARD